MSDPLSSWTDGAARASILTFLTSVTEPGHGYVPAEERVAVFDNDGTLWCEKPLPIQLDFILRRLAAMADQERERRERQPWKAAYEKDFAWLSGVITKHYHGDDTDLQVLAAGVLQAFEGISIEEFEAQAASFLHSAQHPTLGRPFRACGYKPMVELLGHLEANGFRAYIASGGGRDFMRPVTQELYGISRERVIGSSVSLRYQADERGGTLVRLAEIDVVDDGPEKPVQIWSQIGRRPLLAGGNSNGDIPMLQSAQQPGRPSLRLLVLHDDAAREFDYVAGAEGALELAGKEGWTVISMKDDWVTVF